MATKFINYVVFYLILSSVINLNYAQDNQDLDATAIQTESTPTQTTDRNWKYIKPIGGFGHPTYTTKLSNEQKELPNPYLVSANSNPTVAQENQINCEGVNCPSSTPEIINDYVVGQQYSPLNNIPQEAIQHKTPPLTQITPAYNNIGNGINSKMDYHQQQQQQQQQLTPNRHDETNLQTSLHQPQQDFVHLQQSHSNHFEQQQRQPQYNQQNYHHSEQYHDYVQTRFNIQHNQQNTMTNSNYKNTPSPAVNGVDFNYVLKYQQAANEYLRAMLYNIQQEQLMMLQNAFMIAQQHLQQHQQQKQQQQQQQQSRQPEEARSWSPEQQQQYQYSNSRLPVATYNQQQQQQQYSQRQQRNYDEKNQKMPSWESSIIESVPNDNTNQFQGGYVDNQQQYVVEQQSVTPGTMQIKIGDGVNNS